MNQLIAQEISLRRLDESSWFVCVGSLFVAGVGSIGILVRVIDAMIELIPSRTYWREEFIVCSFN